MNRFWVTFLCAVTFAVNFTIRAGEAKTYQVTGPVLEVTPTTITVQKGNDKWELVRTSSTKVTGELKTGAKVTVFYTMVASDVEVKNSKSSKNANTKDAKTGK